MNTYLDCFPCFLRQTIEASRMVTDDEGVHRRVLNMVIEKMSAFPLTSTPPEMARVIHQTIREVTASDDPYRLVKERSNEEALELYPLMKKIIGTSNDPLRLSCKLAAAGNSIDFGIPSESFRDYHSLIENALSSPFRVDHYDEFVGRLSHASSLLYFGDNAGEIVFDKVFIEEIATVRDIDLIFVVRGRPVINDATYEDARYVGMEEVATVISNGSDCPGTVLKNCSKRVQEFFQSADIIIAKGQGNYECIHSERAHLYYLFKVKCSVVASRLNLDVNDMVFMNKTRWVSK
jgi:uncharacterized protein with ATP-grasp and redox domains